MSRWRAVIFDLDDTLYPEREYVLSGFRAVAAWAKGHTGKPADETYEALAGLFRQGVRGDTFNRWLAGNGLPASLAAQCVEVYRGHVPRIRPFPGVPELLRSLHGRLHLGLLSDGYLDVQRAKWRALALSQYFSAVVFTDELGRENWKPHPAPFRRALSLLGVSGAEAVYVADNCAKDFLGARGAGLSGIWARHSEGEYCRKDPATPAHAADAVANSLEELSALLQ